jgi:homoserine dehydrogenase
MVKPAGLNSIQFESSEPSTVRIGLIGLGTVGTGALQVLREHEREIEHRLGCRLEVTVVCSRGIHRKDLSWFGRPVARTADWRKVVHHPGVDIVVELVSDARTARIIAFDALAAGKHLVTANKQLVAEHGPALVERSLRARVALGIEACVAGGTPILHAIRQGLAGEHFRAVLGILNGTTNYILTEMESRGVSFAGALAEAQRQGYAEPNPSSDVKGFDARYKIAILSMICFGQAVDVEKIPVEGITRIEPVDFAYALRLHRTIRLIAMARRDARDGLALEVRPMMIPLSSQLASVRGSLNGILLIGNKGGVTFFSGRGAGGEPTGVAVLSDVVEIARDIVSGGKAATPLGYARWHRARITSAQHDEISAYLRLVVRDRPGILARVSAILARHGINIDSVLQEPGMPPRRMPFVMTLEKTRAGRVRRAMTEISRLPFLVSAPLVMPFADLP